MAKTILNWTIATVVIAIIAIPAIFAVAILWAWINMPEIPGKEDLRHG